MADNEEKQRRLERKRAYNRHLSARSRQRTKDHISSLTAKAEFHSSRADKLEKKNAELMEQIQALSMANQRLSESLEQVAAVGGAGSAGGIGVASSAVGSSSMIGLAPRNHTIPIGRPNSASSVSTGNATTCFPGVGVDQDYLQLVRLLSGTTGINDNNVSTQLLPSVPGPGRLLSCQSAGRLPNLASHSTLSPEELNILIRLNSARNGNNLPLISPDMPLLGRQSIRAAEGQQGILAAAAAPTSSSTDLIAQLLAATQPATGREAAPTMLPSSDTPQARIQMLLRQSLLAESETSASGGLPPAQGNNNQLLSSIQDRERAQTTLMALRARIDNQARDQREYQK